MATNRGLLARINAKKISKKTSKPVTKKKSGGKKKESKQDAVLKIGAASKEIVETFKSVEDAVKKESLNRPNLMRSLKGGNKYKGFYWKYK